MIYEKHLLRVKENTVFILDQNAFHICDPFDLQADNIAGSFKRNDTWRFYEFTRNDDGVLLSTEYDLLKESSKVSGGITNTGIAGKWCKRGAELEHLFENVRKRSEDIDTKKQGKKYSSQIYFVSILEKFNKHYYRLTEMESFSLTCSCIVASYSNYPECSVSNQLPIKKISNTNKKSFIANSQSGLVSKRIAAKYSNK